MVKKTSAYNIGDPGSIPGSGSFSYRLLQNVE